jgi:hypothetical protein
MAALAPAAVMPVAAAYAPPDAPSIPPAVIATVVPAPVATAVIDQFDPGPVAIVHDIRRRRFQFVQDTARVGHAGNGVDRPDSRRNGGRAGKAQNAGKERSSIHRNLQ